MWNVNLAARLGHGPIVSMCSSRTTGAIHGRGQSKPQLLCKDRLPEGGAYDARKWGHVAAAFAAVAAAGDAVVVVVADAAARVLTAQ